MKALINALLTFALLCSGVAHARISDVSTFNCQQEMNKRLPMKAKKLRSRNGIVLVLYGKFEPDSHKKMANAIRARDYSEVWLCSGGGAVVAGIGIGKLLNSVKATVRIPKGFACISACTITTMGGYMRFIDEGAEFVTHASSSFSGFGFKSGKENKGKELSRLVFDCYSPKDRDVCATVSAALEKVPEYQQLQCKEPDHLANLSKGCRFIILENRNEKYLVINALFLIDFNRHSVLTEQVIHSVMQNKLENEVELLEYFHLMLIDGQSKYLKSRNYRQIVKQFKVKNLREYCANSECDLDVVSYIKSLQKIEGATEGDYQQILAIWQKLLTDAELSVKAQLTQYITSNNIQLGVAQANAIELYDAMRTCRIQSLCQLELHNLKKLGYSNAF